MADYLSVSHPTYLWSLDSGLAAGFFWEPKAQSVASSCRKMCRGGVCGSSVCKEVVGRGMGSGFLDSNSSSTTYSSLTLVGYILPLSLTSSPVKWG